MLANEPQTGMKAVDTDRNRDVDARVLAPGERVQLRLHPSKSVRLLFAGSGMLSLGLGIIGIFLPVMPTTVFILIAAYCFSRSSGRFHRALISNERFGPVILNWQLERCMSRRSKLYAISLIVVTFSLTLTFGVSGFPMRFLLGVVGLSLIVYLSRIRTCGNGPGRASAIRR